MKAGEHPGPPLSDNDPIDPALFADLFAETTTLTLATLDPDGSPRATPLFFAADGSLNLYFLSDPNTPHIQNLERNPSAAVGLYPAVDSWKELRGAQLKGVVEQVPESQRDASMNLYRARYPFIDQLGAALERSSLYRFAPTWARLIDNRRGFGHRVEGRVL